MRNEEETDCSSSHRVTGPQRKQNLPRKNGGFVLSNKGKEQLEKIRKVLLLMDCELQGHRTV